MERLLKDAKAISGENYDISSFNDIVNAIHVIQTQIGITGTTAKEAEHTIQGSLNATKAAYQNLVTGLGDSNADIGLLVGNLVDSFGDVTDNVMPVLGTIVDHLPSLLQNMAGPAKAAIGNILDFAFTDLVPGLANFVEGPVTDALDALKKRLPNLVKGLTSALPKLFTNAANLVPGLVDSFSKVAGMAIEGLIGNLPNLVPQLIEGILGMSGSFVKGLGNLVGSLGKGVDKALKSVGIKDKSLADTINDAFASLDPVDIDSIPVGEVTVGQIVIDGPIDTSQYEQKITDAIAAITGALNGHKMSDDQKEQITNDIVSGSGVEALSSAIQIINAWVPKTQADEVAKTIGDTVDKINGALGSFGLPEGTQSKILAYVLAGGSTSAALQAFAGIDASKADSAATQIDKARKNIDDTLKAFVGNPQARQNIVDFIAQGGDVEEALILYAGMSPEAAYNNSVKIKASIDQINDVIADLKIDPAVADNMREFILGGGAIEDALQIFAGMSAEDAVAAAQSMEKDVGTLNEILARYKITFDASSFQGDAEKQKAYIVAALKSLGASDAEIQAAMAGMDELSTSVSAKLGNLFDNLKQAFTDYNTANDAEVSESSKQAMDDYAAQVEAKIDAWAESARTQIAAMGGTADEIAAKTAEINAEADRMKETLDGAVQGTDDWIDKNAGAATYVVKQHTDELDAILETVEGLEARVETLRSSLNAADYSTRTVVEKGMTTSKSMQAEAILLTSKEQEAALLEAAEEYNKTVDKINDEYEQKIKQSTDKVTEARTKYNAGEIGMEEYQKVEQEYYKAIEDAQQDKVDAWEQADADLAKANDEANEQYEAHIMAIMEGMLGGSGLEEKLADVAEKYNAQQNLSDLRMRLIHLDYTRNAEGFTAESLIESMGLDEASVNAMAEQLGMSVEDFYAKLDEFVTKKIPKNSGMLAGTGAIVNQMIPADIGEQADKTLAEAFQKAFGDGDITGALEVIKRAVDEGWLQGVEGIDWTSEDALNQFLQQYIENMAQKAEQTEPVTVPAPEVEVAGEPTAEASQELGEGGESAGENFGHGMAAGINATMDEVVAAAIAVAGAAVAATRKCLGIASPSKVMKGIGEFTGEGFSIGLNDSLGKAVESAQSVVGLLNLKPNMDFSGITGSLGSMVGNLTSAEMSRPIDLYLNGRRMASTMAPYNNYAMNGFNAQTNMGYGRG